jgi:hypothetical protein
MLARTQQRKAARARFTQQVLLCRGRETVALDAQDISTAGVFVRDNGALNTRALLTLRVALPGHKAFTVMGRVTHQHKGHVDGVGVEFLGIMPAQRQRIEAYVAHAVTA